MKLSQLIQFVNIRTCTCVQVCMCKKNPNNYSCELMSMYLQQLKVHMYVRTYTYVDILLLDQRLACSERQWPCFQSAAELWSPAA